MERVRLTAAEIAFLECLGAGTVRIDRRRTLQRAGEGMNRAFVLKSGWAISYTQLGDGSRQIRRLHLPGDLLAMPSLALRHHAEDIEALTSVVVSPFERDAFALMFERHPRLAAIMFMFAQEERVVLGDRLACLGRYDCKARMAFLLLDILNRLRCSDSSVGQTFEMQLTREQMAEMNGMTAIHASRMWSELVADGLVRCDGRHVTILDEPRLQHLSGYVNRARDLDFGWLPSATEARSPAMAG